MSEEEKKAINNMKIFARVHQDMTVVTAEEMDIVLKLVERLQKENVDLQKSVDQIYEDYQDAGLRMFQYSETLDKVSHKQGDELKNILMKEVVRQLNMYRTEILKLIKEGEKHG